MNLPARRSQVPVPTGRRLTGSQVAVARRVDELRREVAQEGLVLEQIPRRRDVDGTIVVDVVFHRALRRGRRHRGARFWAIVAASAMAALAALAWAVVALIEALLDAAGRAAAAVLPGLLGLIVILVGLAAVGAVKGGGTFRGTFRGKMD